MSSLNDGAHPQNRKTHMTTQKPNASSLFAVVLMAASTILLLQQSSLGQSSSLNLKPLLGKSLDAYENVIGKAKLRTEGKGDNLSESRFYKVPGFVRVILTMGNNGNGSVKPTKKLSYVSEVNVHFPSGSISDWKTAVKRVGLSPASVKATPDEGYVALENKAEKWEGAWIPKSPDDKGLDVLQVTPMGR